MRSIPYISPLTTLLSEVSAKDLVERRGLSRQVVQLCGPPVLQVGPFHVIQQQLQKLMRVFLTPIGEHLTDA